MKSVFLCLPFSVLFALSGPLKAQKLEPARLRETSGKPGKPPKNKPAPARPGEEDFVEEAGRGEINWTDQYIEAEGSSVLDTLRFRIKNQALLMARRGAIVDAQRNLLEIVNGVLVEGNTSVKDLVVVSDKVETRVSGLLKGARQVGKPVTQDGIVTVRLRIQLYNRGLADAVDTTPVAPPPVVPDSQANGNPAAPGADSLPQTITIGVTGPYKPRLFPSLTDEQNRQIWALAESYDPTKGKGLRIVKQGLDVYRNTRGKKGEALLDAVQDAAGNLQLTGKSAQRLEKWKKAGLLVWGIVRKLILPI